MANRLSTTCTKIKFGSIVSWFVSQNIQKVGFLEQLLRDSQGFYWIMGFFQLWKRRPGEGQRYILLNP